MADRVFLSFWVRGLTEHNALDSFGRLLGRLPVSRLAPTVRLTIFAIDYSEPPLFEYDFGPGVDIDDLVARCHDFRNPDCAYQLETAWDLWQYEREWQLAPAPLLLTCFAPLFPRDWGEHFLVDFGADSLFLPDPAHPRGSLAYLSNLRSLLHLAGDIGQSLPLRKRRLWSESGEDLAQRLESAVRDLEAEME